MKVRHICAILGVAIAVGTVVFMQGLVATNDHQAMAVAERLLREVPVANEAKVAQFVIDYRPNGRVMQGPPLVACVAASNLRSGNDEFRIKDGECVVTRAMFAQRRLPVPSVGTELTLIGRKKTHYLKIAAVIDWEKPLRGYPNCFVSAETAAAIDEEWRDWEPKTVEELAPGFTSDAGRNFDHAKALLLWAAALTALCLLVNSLFLSIEAKRKEIAILRMVGMTRGGVARRVMGEAIGLTIAGLVLGVLASLVLLEGYVACNATTYPMGMAISWRHIAICLCLAPVVAVTAAGVALRTALKVKPLEAASNRMPRKKHLGMLIAFACGFGAFVAVEVWGSSLMSAFVPSKEWPDAIVSILPGGVSAFDIEKVQSGVKGVRKIHELAPLQVNLEPLEELPQRGSRMKQRWAAGVPVWGGNAGRGREGDTGGRQLHHHGDDGAGAEAEARGRPKARLRTGTQDGAQDRRSCRSQLAYGDEPRTGAGAQSHAGQYGWTGVRLVRHGRSLRCASGDDGEDDVPLARLRTGVLGRTRRV